MRKRDTIDVMASLLAVVFDAVAVFIGFMLAAWLRFNTRLIPIEYGVPENVMRLHAMGAIAATIPFLLVFKTLSLYVRPQTGAYINKIPRIIRGCGLGILLSMVLAFAVKNQTFDGGRLDFSHISRATIAMAFPLICLTAVFLRYVFFRIEWNVARHSSNKSRVLIIGTDPVASHVRKTLHREAMLRSKVAGFVKADDAEPAHDIEAADIMGSLSDLERIVRKERINQLILTSADLGHERIVDIIMLCERNLITFNMVPDLFRIMTSSMDVQSLDDIPLLGISRWPLEFFWNRALKRLEDISGALLGLLITGPLILCFALLVKLTSRGPAFFRQTRCGENGRTFCIYKLRTMQADAEIDSGPVFAQPDDPRTTPLGLFMRRHNIDELPQLWNVLCGDMGLVGPRPERPHFVEKFKEDISRYMWRHVCRPGMTGWAQVNGLRGNTSIDERVKYDLYYLENWSLAFDFKILFRTLSARENAY